MATLYVGGDISKGYADYTFMDERGSFLRESARFDDTPRGHAAMAQLVEELAAKHVVAEFVVGVEATGGLEWNWLALFASIRPRFNVQLYQINPLKLKRFCEQNLHRAVTDAQSSRDIARFLREGQNLGRQYEPGLKNEISFYRSVRNQVKRMASMKAELQQAMVTTHPGLVPYARDVMSAWLLKVLTKWPTAARLARANPATVAKIPYVSADRARELVTAAKQSVGCSVSKGAELLVQMLASEILALDAKIERWKGELEKILANDSTVQLLKTLPGVGPWTAIALRLEIGDFSRFETDAALVAFTGLDPRPKYSGDGVKRIGISKKGPAPLRALLFMSALVALKNPVFKALYTRLRDRGKPHNSAMTACMAKLLRVAYGCVVSGKPYCVDHHAAQSGRPPRPVDPNAGLPPLPSAEPDLNAPISRREKKKRAAVMPQARHARENVVQTTSPEKHT